MSPWLSSVFDKNELSLKPMSLNCELPLNAADLSNSTLISGLFFERLKLIVNTSMAVDLKFN